jgi:hypothetical protein
MRGTSTAKFEVREGWLRIRQEHRVEPGFGRDGQVVEDSGIVPLLEGNF